MQRRVLLKLICVTDPGFMPRARKKNIRQAMVPKKSQKWSSLIHRAQQELHKGWFLQHERLKTVNGPDKGMDLIYLSIYLSVYLLVDWQK